MAPRCACRPARRRSSTSPRISRSAGCPTRPRRSTGWARAIRAISPGAKVCVPTGTTTELNLATYFKIGGMSYTPLTFDRLDQAMQAYLAGRCEALSTDTSALYSVRAQQARPGDHVILPEIISKEPLG